MKQVPSRLLRPLALAVALIVALIAAGCGSGGSSSGSSSDAAAKPGGVIRVGMNAEPTTLNPSAEIESQAIWVGGQINETLFKYTEDSKIVPMLATGSKVSSDGLTWTFPIRKGVTFSNGHSMTAEDVVFSIDAARKSVNWTAFWEEIESVEAVTSSTVRIKTKKPVAAMVADLTHYSTGIVPKNYGGVSEKEFANHPVGTGPFMLKSWKRGREVTLTKNPHYWQPNQPPANEVVFLDIPDENSRLEQLRGGDLDAIVQPNWSSLKSLEESPDLSVTNQGMATASFISLNLNKPQFKDLRIREAISLAIDREGLVKAASEGFGEPAGSILPPAVPYWNQEIKPTAQDVAKAKELVAEAVKAGVDPNFTLELESGATAFEAEGQIIQQNLKEVGISIKLQPLDTSTLLERWLGGVADATLASNENGLPDPAEYISVSLGVIGKPNGAKTAPLEAKVAEANTELNTGKRKAMYYEIQEEMAEELQLIPLIYKPIIWGLQSNVTGFEVTPVSRIWLNKAGFTS
jgi:peptide/nickel transport system substrate-binding protein